MFPFWAFCVTMETIHELSVCEWFVVFDEANFRRNKSLHDPFFLCVCKNFRIFSPRFIAQFSFISFSFFGSVTSVLLIFVLSVTLAFWNFAASSLLCGVSQRLSQPVSKVTMLSAFLFSAEVQTDTCTFTATSAKMLPPIS